MERKIDFQLELVLISHNYEKLVGCDILYSENFQLIPKYIYSSRVLDISPNGKYFKLLDVDETYTSPYYREISQITILDVLTEFA